MKQYMNLKINNHAGLSRHPGGFSMIETLMTMTIFLVIMLTVWAMVSHYGDVTKTENARMNLQQTNRFLGSVMAEELRDAGAVLTLAHTGGFLADTPFFNGIYPLNNNDFPDGLILATGDPDAVTQLSADISAGSTILDVVSALVPASLVDPVEYPPWQEGDIGIILSKDGYYIFHVISADTVQNKIVIRNWAQPVYASGQLDSGHYKDNSPGTMGINQGYKKGSVVARLANFAIYLFDEDEDIDLGRKTRPFIRVSDTLGVVNVLGDTNVVVKSVVSEDIWDMQIAYLGYTNFSLANRDTDPDQYYFAGNIKGKDTETTITTSTDFDQLVDDLKNRVIKQIDLSVVTLTGRFGGRGTVDEKLPLLGDRTEEDALPLGKYSLKTTSFSIELRNFGVIL